MIGARFKPYPEYKDSGIEWLGKIPAHWEAERLKVIASVTLSNVDKKSQEGHERVQLCNYVDVYKNDRVTSDMNFMVATATAEQIRRFSLCMGDVLITKDSESWDDIAVPAVVAENMEGVVCGYHLALLRSVALKTDGRFLARAFSSIGLRDQFWVAANGITRFGLTGDAIRAAWFPVPPYDEQQTIADFLDRETAKIDALVEKKERLIELLQEKRTALITHAVIKGLDPNVPMKDSGIDWLGQIPKHWAIPALKFALSEPIADGPHETPEFLDEGIPFLSAESVKNDRLDFEKKRGFISSEDHIRFSRKYRPRRGDVYMVKSGATTGNVARVETDEVFDIWSPLAAMRPDTSSLITDFLFYFVKSRPCMVGVELSWSFGTQQNIGMGVISNLPLVLPPVDEQRTISAFLDRETAKIGALISKVGEAIERLKEYRTALISAAVTGKIDVRNE
jgi:type I restriction enzyme S subunit